MDTNMLLNKGNLILSTIKNGTPSVIILSLVLIAARWLFRDISSMQLFGLLSDRYRKRLKRERESNAPAGDYMELIDFELQRTSIKKIIGISNSHIQTEIIKIIKCSSDFLDVKYFNKFNIYLSLKNSKVFLDENKVKKRRNEAWLIMVFSFSFLFVSYWALKDDPYLGLALFFAWIVFFMVSIAVFPPPKKLRQKAQDHIDSYYAEQQV
ncbi:hypothetical protein [Serratia plymuthica]|nr:hypothetical protein [Serratia plymuthica]KYG14789.1 hypothetical protein SOD10_41080 [Serratia plymuthica]QPS88565.1 hypothetical protein I6G46_06245 [Serratia plymuthica]QQT81632.1 hypothetical protein I6I95_21885 [Serratia plymuthica]